jgi:hypothetical protein
MLVVGLAGCKVPPIVPDDLGPAPVEHDRPTPSYTELVKQYNAEVERLDRVWASTEVHLRWKDREGKTQSEHGDGTLIIVRPKNVALTIGKLGNTLLWAGSNEDGYWLFDKRENSKVFFGRHRFVDKPCSRSLPMPVQPEAVPYLLGTMPLEATPAPQGEAVATYNGYFLIEPLGLNVRLWLHPQTARPKRVDLLDDDGRKVISAILREPWPVDQADVERAQWPLMAHETQIYVLDRDAETEASVRLELQSASDGEDDDKIKPQVFDFDTLMQVHEPGQAIDLDADCFDAPPGLGVEPKPSTQPTQR